MQENDYNQVAENNAGTDTAKKPKAKDTKQAEVKGKVEKQAYMYLGPNIPGGRLYGGNLFKCCSADEISHLEDLYEKLPTVKRLIVEVNKVPDFKRQLQEQGTQASGLYQQAQMEISAAIKEGVFKNVI